MPYWEYYTLTWIWISNWHLQYIPFHISCRYSLSIMFLVPLIFLPLKATILFLLMPFNHLLLFGKLLGIPLNSSVLLHAIYINLNNKNWDFTIFIVACIVCVSVVSWILGFIPLAISCIISMVIFVSFLLLSSNFFSSSTITLSFQGFQLQPQFHTWIEMFQFWQKFFTRFNHGAISNCPPDFWFLNLFSI